MVKAKITKKDPYQKNKSKKDSQVYEDHHRAEQQTNHHVQNGYQAEVTVRMATSANYGTQEYARIGLVTLANLGQNVNSYIQSQKKITSS